MYISLEEKFILIDTFLKKICYFRMFNLYFIRNDKMLLFK